MTAQQHLEQALGAWFAADAVATPPSEPLATVIAVTRSRRPRGRVLAAINSGWIKSAPEIGPSAGAAHMRSVARIFALTIVALAVVGAAVLAGSRLLNPPPTPHRYLDQLLSAPDLPIPMTAPTLVALADGRVLVIDSAGGGDAAQPALVYDPGSGRASSVGAFAAGGSSIVTHALRLPNGRVLVIGATGSQLFDPSTMQFEPVGPMQVAPRWGAAAALLHDGRILIAGGSSENGGGTALSSAEVFDPRTLTFSATGSMADARAGFSMVTLPDGRVFVTPGSNSSAELYDPATGIFSAAGSTSQPFGGQVIALPDGRVLTFVGTGLQSREGIWIWRPGQLDLQLATSFDEAVTDATLLDDGRIFLIGLCNGRPGGWTGIYVPGGAVTAGPKTKSCRPTSTRLADGRVLIVGGVEPARSTVEIFR